MAKRKKAAFQETDQGSSIDSSKIPMPWSCLNNNERIELLSLLAAHAKFVEAATKPPSVPQDLAQAAKAFVDGTPTAANLMLLAQHAAAEPPATAAAPEAQMVSLAPEEKTILEALADENGMTVTQEDLAGQTRLTDRTVRKWLGELRERGLVNQPRGTKKGFGITPFGLQAIGRN